MVVADQMATSTDFSEELKCPICFESFASPRSLQTCLHTFCEDCLYKTFLSIEKHGRPKEFPCPVCRKTVPGPRCSGVTREWIKSFPVNHVINSLLQCLVRDNEANNQCEPCSNSNRTIDASMFCIECQEFMCAPCIHLHQNFKATKSHKVIPVDELKKDEKLSIDLSKCFICPTHKDKQVELFCLDENIPLCVICATVNHRSCKEIVELKEQAVKTKCRTRSMKQQTSLKKMKTCLNKHLLKMEQNKIDLRSQESEIMDLVAEKKKQVNAQFQVYENEIKEQFKRRQEKKQSELSKDIESCKRLQSSINSTLLTMDSVIKYGTDSHIFVTLNKMNGQFEEYLALMSLEHTDIVTEKFVLIDRAPMWNFLQASCIGYTKLEGYLPDVTAAAIKKVADEKKNSEKPTKRIGNENPTERHVTEEQPRTVIDILKDITSTKAKDGLAGQREVTGNVSLQTNSNTGPSFVAVSTNPQNSVRKKLFRRVRRNNSDRITGQVPSTTQAPEGGHPITVTLTGTTETKINVTGFSTAKNAAEITEGTSKHFKDSTKTLVNVPGTFKIFKDTASPKALSEEKPITTLSTLPPAVTTASYFPVLPLASAPSFSFGRVEISCSSQEKSAENSILSLTHSGFRFGTTSTAKLGTGFGFGKTSTAKLGTGFGFGKTSTAKLGTGFGFGTTSTAKLGTGFGFGTTSTAKLGTDFGFGATSTAKLETDFGFGATSTAKLGTDFGFGATSTAKLGTDFGFGTTSTSQSMTGYKFGTVSTSGTGLNLGATSTSQSVPGCIFGTVSTSQSVPGFNVGSNSLAGLNSGAGFNLGATSTSQSVPGCIFGAVSTSQSVAGLSVACHSLAGLNSGAGLSLGTSSTSQPVAAYNFGTVSTSQSVPGFNVGSNSLAGLNSGSCLNLRATTTSQSVPGFNFGSYSLAGLNSGAGFNLGATTTSQPLAVYNFGTVSTSQSGTMFTFRPVLTSQSEAGLNVGRHLAGVKSGAGLNLVTTTNSQPIPAFNFGTVSSQPVAFNFSPVSTSQSVARLNLGSNCCLYSGTGLSFGTTSAPQPGTGFMFGPISTLQSEAGIGLGSNSGPCFSKAMPSQSKTGHSLGSNSGPCFGVALPSQSTTGLSLGSNSGPCFSKAMPSQSTTGHSLGSNSGPCFSKAMPSQSTTGHSLGSNSGPCFGVALPSQSTTGLSLGSNSGPCFSKAMPSQSTTDHSLGSNSGPCFSKAMPSQSTTGHSLGSNSGPCFGVALPSQSMTGFSLGSNSGTGFSVALPSPSTTGLSLGSNLASGHNTVPSVQSVTGFSSGSNSGTVFSLAETAAKSSSESSCAAEVNNSKSRFTGSLHSLPTFSSTVPPFQVDNKGSHSLPSSCSNRVIVSVPTQSAPNVCLPSFKTFRQNILSVPTAFNNKPNTNTFGFGATNISAFRNPSQGKISSSKVFELKSNATLTMEKASHERIAQTTDSDLLMSNKVDTLFIATADPGNKECAPQLGISDVVTDDTTAVTSESSALMGLLLCTVSSSSSTISSTSSTANSVSSLPAQSGSISTFIGSPILPNSSTETSKKSTSSAVCKTSVPTGKPFWSAFSPVNPASSTSFSSGPPRQLSYTYTTRVPSARQSVESNLPTTSLLSNEVLSQSKAIQSELNTEVGTSPATMPDASKEATVPDASEYDSTMPDVSEEESTILDASKKEPTKLDASKEPTKHDASKEESTKPDHSKEVSTMPDAGKEESTMLDASKEESTMLDASKEESTMPDASKEESTMPDATKEESTMPDATKEESTMPDSNKEESTMPDACKEESTMLDASKEESTMLDASKEESTMPDASKEESTMPDATKEESTMPDANKEESTMPDANKEESTMPDASKEESTMPDASKEVLTMPNASKEESTMPDASKEESTMPDASKEERNNSDASKEESTMPDASKEDAVLLTTLSKRLEWTQDSAAVYSSLPQNNSIDSFSELSIETNITPTAGSSFKPRIVTSCSSLVTAGNTEVLLDAKCDSSRLETEIKCNTGVDSSIKPRLEKDDSGHDMIVKPNVESLNSIVSVLSPVTSVSLISTNSKYSNSSSVVFSCSRKLQANCQNSKPSRKFWAVRKVISPSNIKHSSQKGPEKKKMKQVNEKIPSFDLALKGDSFVFDTSSNDTPQAVFGACKPDDSAIESDTHVHGELVQVVDSMLCDDTLKYERDSDNLSSKNKYGKSQWNVDLDIELLDDFKKIYVKEQKSQVDELPTHVGNGDNSKKKIETGHLVSGEDNQGIRALQLLEY